MPKPDTVEIRNATRFPIEIHAPKDLVDPKTGKPYVLELGASDDRRKVDAEGAPCLRPRQVVPRALYEAIKGSKVFLGLVKDESIEIFA